MQNMFSKYNGHYSDYLPKDDLNFPCDIAPEKHRISCYQVQSRPILDAYGFDFDHAFAFCDSVTPANLARACDNGLGAAASNYAEYNPERVATLCERAGTHESECLYGALTDLEGAAGNTELGERVCGFVRDPAACMDIAREAHRDFPGSVKELPPSHDP
jgi:hypothetical protein